MDTFYGVVAWEERDGFTSAQAFMNLVETALNFLYLYLGANFPVSKIGQVNLVGFSAAILTIAKTILYWLTEYYSGMRHTGHNDWQTYIFLWVVKIKNLVDLSHRVSYITIPEPVVIECIYI